MGKKKKYSGGSNKQWLKQKKHKKNNGNQAIDAVEEDAKFAAWMSKFTQPSKATASTPVGSIGKKKKSALSIARADSLQQFIQNGTLSKVFAPRQVPRDLLSDDNRNRQSGLPISLDEMYTLISAIRKTVIVQPYREKLLSRTLCSILLDYLSIAARSTLRSLGQDHGSPADYASVVQTIQPYIKRVHQRCNDHHASNKISSLRVKARVECLIDLDAAYYALYYHSVSNVNARAVTTPEAYFGNMEKSLYKETKAGEQICHYLFQTLDNTCRTELEQAYGLDLSRFQSNEQPVTTPPWSATHSRNPLLQVLRARWSESVVLFGNGADGMVERFFHVDSSSSSSLGGSNADGFFELACPKLLAEWRDSVRDWMCHTYAYAVPTDSALQVMDARAPEGIVELGCGTGYWLSLLHEQFPNLSIVALDRDPLSGGDSKQQQHNEYHGNVQPHYKPILRGEADMLRTDKFKNKTLFLCYPTPNTSMAYDALKNFAGQTIIHVGELVHGDTGDVKFLDALLTGWELADRVALPNFSNTCYELTVWTKRASASNNRATTLLSCVHCDKSISRGRAFQRSTLCRALVWCDKTCCRSFQHTRAVLSARFLPAADRTAKESAVSETFLETLALP